MKNGKDFIIFPLDVPTTQQAREWVKQLNAHVGMFKIGLELFIHSGPALVEWIVANYNTGIFLDLKLHDIPATVQGAMNGIAGLKADLATVHCGESQTMLEAAVQGGAGKVRVLGVTVLTSVSMADLQATGYMNGMAQDMGRLVLRKAAMAKAAGCAGVVCSGREVKMIKDNFGPAFLAVTPGIRPDWGETRKDDQRRIVTPAMAVADGADYIVIGRPIRDAEDPVETTRRIAAEIESVL
jgi:orotidine-5'-phosphate decarboxylase